MEVNEFNGTMFAYLLSAIKDLSGDIERLSNGESPLLGAKTAIRMAYELIEKVS